MNWFRNVVTVCIFLSTTHVLLSQTVDLQKLKDYKEQQLQQHKQQEAVRQSKECSLRDYVTGKTITAGVVVVLFMVGWYNHNNKNN